MNSKVEEKSIMFSVFNSLNLTSCHAISASCSSGTYRSVDEVLRTLWQK